MSYHIVLRGYTCVNDGNNTSDRHISCCVGSGRHSGISGGCCSLLFGRLLEFAHPLQISQQNNFGRPPNPHWREFFVVCSRRCTYQGCLLLLYFLLMLCILVSMKKELTGLVVVDDGFCRIHSFKHIMNSVLRCLRRGVMTVLCGSVTGSTIPQLCESNLSFVFCVQSPYIHVDFVPQNYLHTVHNIGVFCPRMTGTPSRKVL